MLCCSAGVHRLGMMHGLGLSFLTFHTDIRVLRKKKKILVSSFDGLGGYEFLKKKRRGRQRKTNNVEITTNAFVSAQNELSFHEVSSMLEIPSS